MSDEIDRLARTMDANTPDPDPEKKAQILRLSKESFDALQDSAAQERPISNRAIAAHLFEGVSEMIDRIGKKGTLVVTTGVALFAAVWVSQNSQVLMPGNTAVSELMPLDTAAQDDAADRAASEADRQTTSARVPDRELPQVEEEAFSAPVLDAPIAREAVSQADAIAGGGAVQSAKAPQVLRRGVPPVTDLRPVVEPGSEAFASAAENTLRVTADDPVSTFSIDVDTASYSVVRSSLNRGQLPPQNAVRVEEMINYFPYDYAAPVDEHPFRPTVTVLETPWNPGTELVHIAIQGDMPVIEDRPPLNLVFLIDTSGSMQNPAKLPLLRQSLLMMLSELGPEDQIAIVAYAGSAGRILDPTIATNRTAIADALDRLNAGGSTAGEAGLQHAYATAEEMAEDGEVTRVILATDGDFNVGLSDPRGLENYIAGKRDTGVYLSVLGFGRGNLDDATMQALAQNGNGTAAYIDTLSEARKVLVDQFAGALFPIADDVKIQVEFNPATVAEYRLIGYETRALEREDFNNDKVDAGDINAGRQVTAIYEIARVGSAGVRNDPLRYQQSTMAADPDSELGYLKMRYKRPGEDKSTLIETAIPVTVAGEVAREAKFSVAIAGFGQLLRGGRYTGDWSYSDAAALAAATQGDDLFGYRREAVALMRLAEALSIR